MAQITYSEITPQTYIILDGEPYEALDSHVFRKQQRKPVNQTKLKNLITGKITDRSFHQSEKVEKAEIEKEQAVYIYNKQNEYWFHYSGDKSKRFKVTEELLGSEKQFLTEGQEVTILLFNDRVISIKLPIKIVLKVTEAPPADKGNTAQGGNKQITLESGAVINAPMFIKPGDQVRINTQTGEYTERA